LLLPYIIGANNDLYCTKCHPDKIDFSHLKSKQQWKKLILDGGEQLKIIHKDQLDVIRYIQSDRYDEEKVFNYVAFFANNTKKQIAYLNKKKCIKCHTWRIDGLRTKSEWHELSNSLEPLKKLHHNNKEVLDLINSQSFKDTLPYFIKDISFQVKPDWSNSKKQNQKNKIKPHTFNTNSFNFIYKIAGETKEKTKHNTDIYQTYILNELKKYTFEKPVSITLIEKTLSIEPISGFISILTINFFPYIAKKELQLTIKTNKKIYTTNTHITVSEGWTIKNEKVAKMKSVLSDFLKEADMNISKTKK